MRDLAAIALILVYLLFCWLCWQQHRRRHFLTESSNNGSRAGEGDTLIAYASQTGNAHRIAMQTAQQWQASGKSVQLVTLNQLTADRLTTVKQLFIVASTYGEGEAPDNGNRLLSRNLRGLNEQSLASVEYLILALGDSSYTHFCGFAQALHHALHQCGAQAIADPITVDRLDESALRHWQYYVGKLSGTSHFADWSKPAYQPWTLVARTCVNPGSQGAPAYHLRLQPALAHSDALNWQAGDIAEIGPCNSPMAINRFLQRLGRELPKERLQDKQLNLNEADWIAATTMDDEALVDWLPELAHREYSIASVPEEGFLDLLVRQVRLPAAPSFSTASSSTGSSSIVPRDDSARRALVTEVSYGVGSGWLTVYAPLGGQIRLRVRANPHFHSPAAERPLILIGNGTGIAGLRAHLANPARARSRHWLFFGERSAGVDDFFGEDLRRWQVQGLLRRVDNVFSRDAQPGAARYVQDLLAPQAEGIRQWVAEGAAIYVCGSLQGMASAVDEALGQILGRAQLEQLADEQRYCRDVY